MDNKISKESFLKRMKTARENVNKFAKLPFGSYYCLLAKAFYKPSSKDKPMVTFVYKVLDGEMRDKEHRVFYHIWNDTAFNILVQDLENLGFPTEEIVSMEKLIEVLNSIESYKLNVSILIYENTKNPQYPQTRIESTYEGDAAAEEPTAEVEAPAAATTEAPGSEEPAPENKVDAPTDVVEPDIEPEPEPEAVVEPEPVAAEEETVELDVGSKVSFKFKEAKKIGTIKNILEGGEQVKISSEGLVYTVKVENILAPVK